MFRKIFLSEFRFYWEGVYTWNFIRTWNSSQDEIIPVYREISRAVYTFFPRWNFIPGWIHPCQSAFTCNRDEIHPGMKLVPGWKNFCLNVSFIPGWNSARFNLIWKETSHWVWKHIIEFIILAWYVKTSDNSFFREVTFFIIFVCSFSY